MTANRHPHATVDGTFIPQDTPTEPPPTEISEADMELLLAFQQDLQAAQRAYATLMNQYAGRYQLREGDRIEMSRSITRRDDGKRA